MNARLLLFVGLALLALAVLCGLHAWRQSYTDRPMDDERTVYIESYGDGYRLIRNGEPFEIRGAGGDAYFRELAAVGGNTIRLFDSTNLKEKLNEAHRHGLAVIVDLYIPRFSPIYNPYEQEEEVQRLTKQVMELVSEHKDHPALLMWNLGNELNYPLTLRKNDFIRTFNEWVAMIQAEDPNHPVSTSIIGAGRKTMLSIFYHSPGLDLIGFNTFGNTMYVNRHVNQVSRLIGKRPYFISELGPDGPWESTLTSWGVPIEGTCSAKSNLYRIRSEMVKKDGESSLLGSLVFYWGEKLERTHTWFSLFRDGAPSTRVRGIQEMWNSPSSISSIPSNETEYLRKLVVNQREANENVVLVSGEPTEAEALLEPPGDSLRIEWEIYPEAWFSDTHRMVTERYRPIDTFLSMDGSRATFRAPREEGPYRIFVYVYHPDGMFETANVPFYVLGGTEG